jgi:PadR family transcriptional regulator PadR
MVLTDRDGQGLAGNNGTSWGRIRGFIQPCLLLLLQQRPGHGYELMDRLSQREDDPDANPALVYRTLRQLERNGLVSSSWDTGGQGPARRLYEIAPEGVKHLNDWADNIRHTKRRLDRFLEEYEMLLRSVEE